MTLDTSGDVEQAIFATGGYDHTIKIWQTHSGICQRTVQHADSVCFRLLLVNFIIISCSFSK